MLTSSHFPPNRTMSACAGLFGYDFASGITIVGKQDSFNWKGVIASAIAAPIAQAIGNGVNGALQNDFGKVFSNIAATATSSVVKQGIYSAVTGGKMRMDQVVSDVFNNVIGQSFAGNSVSSASQQEQILGATFADDMAARKASNYWNPESASRPAAEFDPSSIPTFPDAPPMTAGQLAFLENSVTGQGVGIGNLRPLDNRALLNAAEQRMNPGYYTTNLAQTYSPHLNLNDVGDYFSGKASGFVKGAKEFFTEDIPNLPSAIKAFANDPLGTMEKSTQQMQDSMRKMVMDARQGNFRTAGEVEGGMIGKSAAGSVLGMAAGGVVGELGALRFTNTAKPLAYDISKWGDYGLPSDGVFARTLTPRQYRDFLSEREISFGGKPSEGYPSGMGFIGSAEETRGLTTVKGYREGLKLDYDPKYVLEFQLRDPSSLQNVIKAPYEEFVRGGVTGAGFKEWNYPGINNTNIINPKVRVLK